MKNMCAIIALLILTAIPAIAGGSREQSQPESESLGPVSASIEYIEGSVWLNGEIADYGDKVVSGDKVETGDAGVCDIVFENGNIVSLAENTLLLADWDKAQLTLESGTASMVLGNLNRFVSDTQEFSIRTSSTIAGVRGTTIFAKWENPESYYFCLCNGKVHIQTENQEIDLEATHHKAFRVIQNEEGIRLEDAEMLYHTDDDMEHVADKIDYTIPWKD